MESRNERKPESQNGGSLDGFRPWPWPSRPSRVAEKSGSRSSGLVNLKAWVHQVHQSVSAGPPAPPAPAPHSPPVPFGLFASVLTFQLLTRRHNRGV